MSLARSLRAIRLTPRIATLSPTSILPRLVVYRTFTTTKRLLADVKDAKSDQLSSFKSPSGTATLTAHEDSTSAVSHYKGGPSALSKAVHLFFFTEIIRGMQVLPYSGMNADPLIQGCGSSSSSFFVRRTLSCIRSKRALSHLASVANMRYVDIPVERRDVLVSLMTITLTWTLL